MNHIQKNQRLAVLLIASIALLSLTGCASTKKLRASEDLTNQNKMKDIAVIGGSMVVRPRRFGNEAVLSLSDSKKAIEIAVKEVKKELEVRGYNVVYSEPVGVGYKWPAFKENWVYNYESKEGEPDKWQIQDGSPAFEYNSTANNGAFRQSIRDEYERLNVALNSRKVLEYIPVKANLQSIQQVTGGDTICMVRTYGRQYSAGRVVGDVALGVLAAMFGGVGTSNSTDSMTTLLVCSNPVSGQVIWQDAIYETSNPVEPGEEHFKSVLNYFPNAEKTLDTTCKMTDKVKSMFDCEDKKIASTRPPENI